MLELSSETFHSEAKKCNFLLCIFYQKSVNNADEILSSILGSDKNTMSATMACIDTERSSDVAQMFGLNPKEPAILMMREQIVLYCEPLSTIEKSAAYPMLQQISKLNMGKIKEEIEIEKQSRAHIFGRNVCPTAKRVRGK